MVEFKTVLKKLKQGSLSKILGEKIMKHLLHNLEMRLSTLSTPKDGYYDVEFTVVCFFILKILLKMIDAEFVQNKIDFSWCRILLKSNVVNEVKAMSRKYLFQCIDAKNIVQNDD